MAQSFPHIQSLRQTDRKEKSSDFPVKTFRTLFFFESPWKNAETSSQTGAIETFEKHWQCCETP